MAVWLGKPVSRYAPGWTAHSRHSTAQPASSPKASYDDCPAFSISSDAGHATTIVPPAKTVAPQSKGRTPIQPAALTTGVLNVSVTPKGSEIQVDGRTIGQSPLSGPITLTQGPHRLDIKSPTGKTYSEVVTIGPGQSVSSTVDLVPSKFNYRLWGWVGMGTGGALVLGGAVAGIMALGSSGDLETCRASNECLQTQKEADLVAQVRDDAFIADVLLWPGLAIAGTGVLLYLLAPDEAPKGAATTNIGWYPCEGRCSLRAIEVLSK